MTGYGYGKALLTQKSWLAVFPYFSLAIGAHAFYNFLATFSLFGIAVGVGAAIFFSLVAITYIRGRIRYLDSSNTHG